MDVPVTGPAQIPATVEVICGTLRGTYDVAKTKILYLSNLGGIREATPTEFERLGGRQATKKWKQSIRVVDAHGQPGKSLGEWLAGTAGTAGDGQRQAFAWLTMGQRGAAWADGGDGARGTTQSKSAQLREQFQLQLLDFLHGRIDNPGAGPGSQAPGGEFGPVTLGSHTFDLRKMYIRVRELGGYTAMQTMADSWGRVAATIGLETTTPNTPHACRAVYEHYLLRAERLERAREVAGIPAAPSPQPPRRQPSSPTGSGPSLPGGGGGGGAPPVKQEPHAVDRAAAAVMERAASRAAAPAGPAVYTARRSAQHQQQQWGPHGSGRSGGHDRRVIEETRSMAGGGQVGHGKGSYGSARNGGPGYDSGPQDDGLGAYDGPGAGRGGYDAPGLRVAYDAPGRGGYGGVSGRGGYDGPGRTGYDSGGGGTGRGGYDDGRRGFDAGGGRGGYDADERAEYLAGGGGGTRGAYEASGGRGLDMGGRGAYDAGPGSATASGGRYRGDTLSSNPSLERRLAGLEALLQGAHAVQPQGRYDSQYEHRSSLLPLDINDDQLLLAAGLGLGRDNGRDNGGGGPMATPLVLDNSALVSLGARQQAASINLIGAAAAAAAGNGGISQQRLLQLQLSGGGGGGRQSQDPREALLVTVAGGPGSGGLGGRGALAQAVEHGSLVSLAGGPAAMAGRLLPITLGRGGGVGGGAGEALQAGWLSRANGGRAGGGGGMGALQLQTSRAAALLGLQADLREGTGVDDPTISNLLSEYFGSGGGLTGLGLVRTGSGNIGVNFSSAGVGYKRGMPDDGGGGGGSGESGGGPHKRSAM